MVKYSYKLQFQQYGSTGAPTNFIIPASSGGTPGQGSAVFTLSLSNLPAYANYQNMYDSYRITRIKVRMVPSGNTASIDQSTQNCFIYSVMDYNDYALLTTAADAQSYQNCRVTKNTSEHIRSFVPAVAYVLSDLSSNTFVQAMFAPWLSTNDTITPHGYMKIISDKNPTPNTFTYEVHFTVWVEFKSVRNISE